MTAANVPLQLEQYATARLGLTWTDESNTPVNLTGWTAALQIRQSPGATPIVSLTHLAGITLGGAAGTIDIVIPGSVTAAIPVSPAQTYGYDLVMVSPGGAPDRLIEGGVTVKVGYTNPGP